MDTERDEPLEVEAVEVDEPEDLESAMREALEAVESSARRPADEATEAAESGEPLAEEDLDGDDGDGLDELTVLRKEVADLRDRSVRTLADFDNFRKRAERERLDQQRYAGTEVLRDLLGVVDNLERAIESSGEFEDLKSGVELIVRQVFDLLRRHGVMRVEARGRVFDPSLHEAVSRQESDDVSVPTVQEELQSGYLLRDRLLRPAMVVVTVPPPPATPSEDAE